MQNSVSTALFILSDRFGVQKHNASYNSKKQKRTQSRRDAKDRKVILAK